MFIDVISTINIHKPQYHNSITPQTLFLLVYEPHENYSYLRTINHSEIGVFCTNLTIVRGHHFVPT